ncbi:MAG: MG2 domain-containing protein, partial [Myxococcota bacterium]
DRGVYRPGTAVHVVGVLREGDELATAANVELRIELTHPSRTRPLAEKSLRSSARGSLAARLPLPEDAPLGGCTLRLIAGEDDEAQLLATAPVRIDQVRPHSFRVDLSGPTQVRSGEALAVQVDAAFLFGAPLRDAELRWSLLRQGSAGAPRAYADYDFGPVDADYAHRTEAEGIARTDEHGQATLEFGALSTGGWEQLALEVEAVDRSGQSVTAHHRVTLMASALRPGLRRGDAFIDGRLETGGTPLEIDAVVLDAAGERVWGAPLSARIVREGWHRWWEWRGGALQPRRQHQAEEVFRCAFAGVDDACAYTPERSGTYVIEVRVRDEDGKEALASRRVYVAGLDEAPDRDPPGAPIALTPRQPTLRVGETAELALESPWPGGEMLITVSRDTILHTERRRLSAGSQIVRFAITEAMVPNAFVTASLVKPRTGEPRLGRSRAGRGSRTIDPGAPDLRIGATEIAVRPLSSELPLRIEAPESAPAGERVEVVVYTDAEVSLFAVDERLLRLDGHELGDLAAGLWGRDGAAFGIEDLRRTLRARRVREDLRRGGDGGGEGAARVLRAKDRLSRPVPLWAAGIPAEDGVVRQSFELPEGAATYRIIALAIGDGAAVRHVQADLQATTDVVIEGQLPTFATEGDQFDARFVVHATGRDLADEFVAHVGNETVRRTLNLAQGESETVSVAVTVQGAAGSALDVRAQVGGASFERALPVAARGRWTHTRAFGAGAEPTTLRFPEGAVGQLRLTASRAPLLGAESIAQRISQSAWRDLPTRAAAAIALAAGDGASIDADERQARLNRAAERLVALQQSDGSFYRTTNAYATPWQSVLGAHALYELHEAGADVPEDALARSRSWLQDVINRAPFGDGDYADRDSGLAHAIYTLSRYGEWSPSVADSLFARREQLSLTARAWLALAYLSSNDEEASVLLHEVLQYLTKDVSADATLPPSVRYAERRGAMLGPVLAALSEEPALALRAAPIAEQLFAETRHGHLGWRSPVDAAFALFGLRVYAERFEANAASRCTLDGEALEPAETSAGTQRFVLNVAELAGEDRVLQLHGGPVFYVLEADFAEPLAHEDRAARGNAAALHRRFERLNGGVLSRGDSVPLGAMIRVRLFTHSESGAQQTQLFDPLAAGWQALEGQLQTAPASALRSMLGMGPEDDAMDPRGYYAARSASAIESRRAEDNAVLFALSHLPRGLQEFTYVVRATTPGRFSIPPATLEERRGLGVFARSSDFELHVAELAETEER